VAQPPTGETYEVACPHCKKPFQAQLISGDHQRLQGFKCPHCKLFVPRERIGGEGVPAPG